MPEKNKQTNFIALLEDDDEVRGIYQYIIDQHPNFSCVGYPSSEHLLNALDKPLDLVIMDVNLPGMSGIECTKKLKAKRPEIQVMMFTVYENNENIFEALKAGANGYMLKQSSPENIISAIEEMLAGGAPMSGIIAKKIIDVYRNTGDKLKQDYGLSKREQEILELLSEGFRYQDIADQLHVTFSTVRTHIYNIYTKLHVDNRTSAINKWRDR